VADEVRLGDPSADDQMVAQACLLCRTPALETRLGEDGGSVSAGQRPRIALARVVLRVRCCVQAGSVPLVLLDEPSEDLDRETERIVAHVMVGLSRQATVIIATHSDLFVSLADRRIELVAGRMVSNVRQAPPSIRMPVTPSEVSAGTEPTRDAAEDETSRLGLRRLIRAEGLRRRLAVAGALSALAGLAGLALTATSIWLISRAAEHPNVQALAIAVVGVRTFALVRALLATWRDWSPTMSRCGYWSGFRPRCSPRFVHWSLPRSAASAGVTRSDVSSVTSMVYRAASSGRSSPWAGRSLPRPAPACWPGCSCRRPAWFSPSCFSWPASFCRWPVIARRAVSTMLRDWSVIATSGPMLLSTGWPS
jgi:hypothetical protein